MNIFSVAITLTLVQCVLMIICLMLYFRGRKNWVSLDILFFLLACTGIDIVLSWFFPLENKNQGIPIVILAIQAFVLFTFVRSFRNSLDIIELRFRKRMFSIGVYAVSFAILILSYLLFIYIQISSPHLHAIALGGLIIFAILLTFIVSHFSWRSRIPSRIFFLFFIAAIAFVSSAFYHSETSTMLSVNTIFITMFLAVIFGSRLAAKEEPKASLEDFNLTKRQKQVAELMLSGLSYGQIAKKLHIAESTASKHGSDIFAKTGCTDKNSFRAKFAEAEKVEELVAE
ncbi:MAG: helix-turn-helix transcriptional regulator [bacterium]|nr:helix-turn-helix transcriptional regulator [bacterium]